MTKGVLLIAHGSPDSPGEMEDFLGRIMKRRKPAPEFVREMQQRYETFGGRSPLPDIARAQAAALEKELGLPVRVGMRYWNPSLPETVAAMESEGIDRIVAVVLSPYACSVGTGEYLRRAQESAKKAELVPVAQWHLEPDFIAAWVERVGEAGPPPYLFTAHAVPVAAADPYERQVRETIDAILEKIPAAEWDFAWQSRPAAPGTWTEPDVDSKLKQCGWKSVTMIPVGFVCDHAEVLYDIDHLHRSTAESLGMKYGRTRMLNDSPLLTRALAAAVRKVS